MANRHIKVKLKDPEPNETSNFRQRIYYYDFWYPVTKAEYVEGLHNGSKWFDGTSITASTSPIPEGLDVSIGDYYLNSNTWNIWECISLDDTETTDRWLLVGNIKGADGNSINIKGSVTSPSNLPTDPQPEIGDCYVINGSSTPAENGHLWVYTGTAIGTNCYEDLGSLQGPAGIGIYYSSATTGSGTATINNDTITNYGRTLQVGDLVISASDDLFKITDVNSTNCSVYYITNIKGTDGTDGTDGATWQSGTAVTSTSSNVPDGMKVGDYYLNNSTSNVYKCTSTSEPTKWSLECNIKGQTGEGTPGADGSKWFSGTAITGIGTQSATITGSKVGDYYLNTGTNSSKGNVYKCTGNNSWAYQGNIKGTDGTGSGTVTSVQITAASPITSSNSGQQTPTVITEIGLADASAHYILAGPTSGQPGSPTFRQLDISDIQSPLPDLYAIESLSGTNGLLKKTADNTWVLDTNSYLTSHQTLYNLTLQLGGNTSVTYQPNVASNTFNVPVYNNNQGGGIGLVPSSTSGQRQGNYYLKADGTWSTPTGGTTYSAGTGINIDANNEISCTVTNTDRYVNNAAFTDDTTYNSSSPVKMTLTRAGSDSATVIANIPKISSTSAGVVPKGVTVSSQTQSTKFLREDGTWQVPSYTTDTNTTYKFKLNGYYHGNGTTDLSNGGIYAPYNSGSVGSILISGGQNAQPDWNPAVKSGSSSGSGYLKVLYDNNDNYYTQLQVISPSTSADSGSIFNIKCKKDSSSNPEIIQNYLIHSSGLIAPPTQSTNGLYLKATVTNNNTTFSWDTPSGGTSYTATAPITITGNAIGCNCSTSGTAGYLITTEDSVPESVFVNTTNVIAVPVFYGNSEDNTVNYYTAEKGEYPSKPEQQKFEGHYINVYDVINGLIRDSTLIEALREALGIKQ